MNVKNPEERLNSLWGLIDRQHNEVITSHVVGKRVLDIGCGYGSLTEYLRINGYDAEGIDSDKESIRIARRLFPQASTRLGRAEDLMGSHSAELYDTIVLKDALHHLVGEGDVVASLENFRRLLVPHGRLVILDPNPTPLLRTARRIIGHVDPEVALNQAHEILGKSGFVIENASFYEVLGLGLSGGYVGPRLVPDVWLLNQTVAGANHWASRFVNAVGLGRVLCLRYVIQARKVEPTGGATQ